MSSMPKVLVQMVGDRRNRGRSKDRPAVSVARVKPGGAAFDEVELVWDPLLDNEALATSLAKELGAKRRVRACRVRAAGALSTSRDGHRLASAARSLAPVIAGVLQRHEGHLDALEVFVSVETGTPAQQIALAEGIGRAGVEVSLVGLDGPRPLTPRRPRAPGLSLASDCEGMLDQLGGLDDGGTVLLTGPSGAGKTRYAKRLHERWAPDDGAPFEHRNCAAFPEALLESELFGHVKGAFTGATAANEGAFAAANGGTLFLDEIGELPVALQSKLLTAMDHERGARRFRRIGGKQDTVTRARIVLATNRDLDARVREGAFRNDLLARISTWVVRLPPLRDRPFDVLRGYLAALDDLAREGSVAAFPRPAWREVIAHAYAPTSVWRWNHRDVRQSAERMVSRARTREGDRALVRVDAEVVGVEHAELDRRWKSAVDASADDWTDLEGALRPGEPARLTELERCEARLLLRASRETRTHAEAWRYAMEHRLWPTRASGDDVANPTAAFQKRLSRFAWR